MAYCSSTEIWKHLGKDAYTKVRSEIVGTSSTTTSTNYELDHDNLIDTSLILYTDSSVLTSSAYTSDLDDGSITELTGASSGSVLTADYDYGDLPDSIISQMIDNSDNLIETETGRTFGENSATEYLNVDYQQKVFFLKNYPVTTLTTIERNISIQTTTPDWETLTEGLGEDYIANSEDLSIGRVRFINNFPYQGEDMLKATYNYGSASTPNLVKELSILLTLRQLANSSVYKSIMKGYDNFTPIRLDEINIRIEELKRILRKQSIELV